MTIRVFPEPDRWYRVLLERNGFVGKLVAVNWLTNRTVSPIAGPTFGPNEVRIRPETLVFEVPQGYATDDDGETRKTFRQRIVRWEAISWVEEAESYEASADDG